MFIKKQHENIIPTQLTKFRKSVNEEKIDVYFEQV